jgi:hypothetical protein
VQASEPRGAATDQSRPNRLELHGPPDLPISRGPSSARTGVSGRRREVASAEGLVRGVIIARWSRGSFSVIAPGWRGVICCHYSPACASGDRVRRHLAPFYSPITYRRKK